VSNEVFTFRFMRGSGSGYAEGPEPRRISTDAQSSIEFTRNLDSTARFVAGGRVVLNGQPSHTYNDWLTFYAAREYGAQTMLYRAQLAAHSEIRLESVGTAAGGAGESFTLDRKYIDPDTLVVEVGSPGVIQPAADYTLTNNNTAPQIDTNAGFDAGAVFVSYRYRHKVKIANAAILDRILRHDIDLGKQGAVTIPVSLREYKAGDSLV
jgi:hypothetical protein